MTRDVRRLNPAAGAGPANCLNAGLIHAPVRLRVSELGVTISTLYQRLLQEIGLGTLRSGSEIYYPLAVRELYQPFFDNVVMLFQPCFPLCCDNQWQEIWVIDADQKIAVPIGHETVPDEWPEDE